MPVIDKPGVVWLQGVRELAQYWSRIEGVTKVSAYSPGLFQKNNPPTITFASFGVIIPCLVAGQFQRVALEVEDLDTSSRVKRAALEIPQAIGLVIGTKAPLPRRQPSAPVPQAEPPPVSDDDTRSDAEVDAELAALTAEFADLDPSDDTVALKPPPPLPTGDPVAAKKAPNRRVGVVSYQNAVDHLMSQGKGASFEFEVDSPRDILRAYGVAEASIQPWLTKMQNKGILSKKHSRQNGEGHCFTVYRNTTRSASSESTAGANGTAPPAGRPAASDQDLSLEAVREHVAEIHRHLDALRAGGAEISYTEKDGLKVCVNTTFQIKIG